MARVVGAGTWLAPPLRRVGLDNLHRAFPEQSERWRRATLHASLRSLGWLVAEVAHFPDLDTATLRERIGFTSPDSEACWRARMAAGRAIVATGHFGNWELFAFAQGMLGHPVHIVHRPLRNPRIDDLLTRLRTRAGTGIIYKHAAGREILRRLRAGGLVAIPIDQHAPGASGSPVEFFGRPASTTLGPARLAQLARVPIQTAVLVRRGESIRHDILMLPPIDPPPPGRDASVLCDTMLRVNRQFEEIVRAHPEQWLWVHRRWRV